MIKDHIGTSTMCMSNPAGQNPNIKKDSQLTAVADQINLLTRTRQRSPIEMEAKYVQAYAQ